MRVVIKGCASSGAIVVGYLPIAFSFGLTAVHAGLRPGLVIMTSACLFAGSSQFFLITLLVSGAGLAPTLATVLLMNARHLFYGPAIISECDKYRVSRHPPDAACLLSGGHPVESAASIAPSQTRVLSRRAVPRRLVPRHLPSPCLSFGLTDEVFATSMSRLPTMPFLDRERWCMGLQTAAYGAWVAGTAAGACFATRIPALPPVLQHALWFVLPALFFALLLEIGLRAGGTAVLVAGVAAALLPLWMPVYGALAAAMLAGTVALAIKRGLRPAERVRHAD